MKHFFSCINFKLGPLTGFGDFLIHLILMYWYFYSIVTPISYHYLICKLEILKPSLTLLIISLFVLIKYYRNKHVYMFHTFISIYYLFIKFILKHPLYSLLGEK